MSEQFLPAATPQQAIEEQIAMAHNDTAIMYDFTAMMLPVSRSGKTFAKCLHVAKQLPRKTRGPHPKITKEIKLDVTRITTILGTSLKLCKQAEERLTAFLRTQRLERFKVNFRSNRFPTAPGECLLCYEKRDVMTFDCCRTDDERKTICLRCLEDSAFEMSKYGTENSARCPFCAKQYAVYVSNNETQ